jgi:hypothetical protein
VTDAKAPDQAAHLGRLGTAAAWISAVCCLPHLALKVLWTVDVPLGIDDRSVLVRNDWVAGNAVMAVVQLTGLLVVLGLTWPCAHRMPTWLLLIPVWVGTGLLFEVVVGAVLMGVFSASSQASGGSNDFGGIQPWVFVMVYSSFAGQGIALAIAFACHVRSRWGRLLGQRTSEVLARPTARAGSWVEVHLVGMAEAVAGMAVAVALVCGYWAAGGSFGASGAQPDPTRALQASGVVAAVTAVAGLFAIAGRWGRQTPFWVPAALTWVGSGAVAAFDGLILLLFLVFRPDGADAGWGLTDTILVIKVVVGLLAGAVGALAVSAAAEDLRLQRADPGHVLEGRPVERAAAESRQPAAPSVLGRRGEPGGPRYPGAGAAGSRPCAAAGARLRRANERPAAR